MIVCDTGPLLAAAIVNDDHHRACTDLLTSLHLAERKILVPGTVAAEVGFMLATRGGSDHEAQFLAAMSDGSLTPVDLTAADYQRAGELVTQYSDLGLGTTDATVIVKPRHVERLVLLPE
jgi:predicted nucleic acid-binding protein